MTLTGDCDCDDPVVQLNVQVLSPLAGKKSWPLHVNHRLNFEDLTAILVAKFEGLSDQLLFFGGNDHRQVGSDPSAVVSSCIKNNEVLIVQEGLQLPGRASGGGRVWNTIFGGSSTPPTKSNVYLDEYVVVEGGTANQTLSFPRLGDTNRISSTSTADEDYERDVSFKLEFSTL